MANSNVVEPRRRRFVLLMYRIVIRYRSRMDSFHGQVAEHIE